MQLCVYLMAFEKSELYYVFFTWLPGKDCGQLYGDVGKDADDANCVYLTSFIPRDGLRELGTFNAVKDDGKRYSSTPWVKLKSNGSDILVDKLFVGSIDVPSESIVLYLYDGSLVESEILELNSEFKSSQCLSKLFGLIRPQGQLAYKQLSLPNKPLGFPWRSSKVLQQSQLRFCQLVAWPRCTSKLGSFNLMSTVLCDLLFGFFILQLLHWFGGTNHTVELLLESIKVIADQVHGLIVSLMGVPYGLKLNKPLSTVLGKFFLYHLYLWKTYIDIIQPFVSVVISVSSTVGYIGLSFQMALLTDIISVASFHCYCFYIYATRLYFIAQHGLQSTMRMFRGRKSNPLRCRVDSGEFTWDQLCVGMLIFCTLLFLLPTILVYYIVFLSLRLGVLVLQGTLKRLMWLTNTFPFYTLILWILNSPVIAGSVSFEMVSLTKTRTIRLIRVKLPLLETLKLTVNPSVCPFPQVEWLKRLKEIWNGELIFSS